MYNKNGFTLIEVMIVVVIIGILASIAYPAYLQFVIKSARSEGVAAIMNIANLQEQHYLDNRVYATDVAKLGLTSTSGAFVTESGYYSVSSTNTADFTITATPLKSPVTADTVCTTITLTSAGIKGPSSECWK